MTTTTNVEQVKLNIMTQAQYESATKDPTQLYMVTDVGLPTVNDATLTIQKNGTDVATFSANASTNATANITVPTNTNELTNGAGFITSSDIPVSDVTVNGISVVSNGVAVIPKIPTSSDYWTVGTSGVSDYQTTYSKKTIFYTASGAQDNGFKMLASSDTAPSSTVGAWSGRCLIGNEKRTFLLGTARNSASGSQSICGLGAHTWGSATSQTSAAWDNVYIQPDGSTGVYLGGNGWRGSSGWFRVLNNNSGSASYRTSINTGTNSSPAWKTVLPNNTTATNSILFTPTVGTTFTYTYATAVNGTVTANYGTSYGYGTSAAGSATALGYNAKATGSSSIQIGQGTNSTANTLSVGLSSSVNVQLLDSSGVIPAGRLNIASSVDSSSTNSQMVGAKLFYDTVGDIETLINNINSGS